jgi:hypothetical protein
VLFLAGPPDAAERFAENLHRRFFFGDYGAVD